MGACTGNRGGAHIPPDGRRVQGSTGVHQQLPSCWGALRHRVHRAASFLQTSLCAREGALSARTAFAAVVCTAPWLLLFDVSAGDFSAVGSIS